MAPAAKRARPQLVFHFGRCVGVDSSQLVHFAVAAELVHTASLLHDDVVDEGTERRNRPTVNERWNDVTAVLAGDALLCSALVELRKSVRPVTDRAVDVVSEMTRSILHEIDSRRRVDVTRRDWEFVAAGKTGALFGWCGAAPALHTGAPEAADRLAECGRRLGIAFQLADDLLDLMPQGSGKDAYADIKNGHISYPLVCAVDEDPSIADHLEVYWNERPKADGAEWAAPDIAERIRETSAISETRGRIRSEVDRALAALGTYAERPGGEAVADWAQRLCARV